MKSTGTAQEIVADSKEGAVQEAINKVRPLNATQAKALRTLVEQDFDLVRADMDTMYRAQRREIERQIEEDYAQREVQAESVYAAVDKAVAAFRAEMSRIRSEAQSNGATVKGMPVVGRENGYGWTGDAENHVTVQAEGKQEALIKALAVVEEQYQQARNALQRKQVQNERRILVAQVTGETEDLLNTLPSAETLMLEAAQERAQQQIGA